MNDDRTMVDNRRFSETTDTAHNGPTSNTERSGTERGALHTDDLLPGNDARNTGTGSDDRQHSDSDVDRAPLFANSEDFRRRWEAIQTGFVDEPRRAVESADALVAEVIQLLVQSFADERSRLEGQWSEGNQASTEDLRVALRRYRSFFDRLLST